MTLAENVTLTGGFGETYTVGKYIAQGGQGSVHLVHKTNGECLVVKWYFEQQATPAQRAAIQMLVNSGPPKGKFQDSFVWPLDIVTTEGSQLFGYVMPLIDKVRFASLNNVFSKRRREPSLGPMCMITFLAAGCYRALHASGQCYRDISPGNLLFDPASGEVRICDNDNVGPDETTTAQIHCTWEYMAPEVASRAANPSTGTDLHSLAVLLFKLWMWHHPLHGLQEERIRSLDDAAYLLLYGKIPSSSSIRTTSPMRRHLGRGSEQRPTPLGALSDRVASVVPARLHGGSTRPGPARARRRMAASSQDRTGQFFHLPALRRGERYGIRKRCRPMLALPTAVAIAAVASVSDPGRRAVGAAQARIHVAAAAPLG